ncbi:MAG TPA: hypothetical protein PLT66_07400, partial [Bacillota bacterium]|nr:hypothetical protein [Bacillota bacterium]
MSNKKPEENQIKSGKITLPSKKEMLKEHKLQQKAQKAELKEQKRAGKRKLSDARKLTLSAKHKSKENKAPLTKKQKLLRAAIIAAAVLVVCGTVVLLLPALQEWFAPVEESDHIFLYPVDYTENIFDDPTYMNKTREVYYTENGTSALINDGNTAEYRSAVYFFCSYFESIVNGDAGKYRTFFDLSRYDENKLPAEFTMQKIYDIDVRFVESQTDSADSSITYEFYEVRYKILYNNGTFRSDIG